MLISGDISGDVRCFKNLLFSSLRPYTYVKETSKVFIDNGITLNIADLLDNPEIVSVDTERLLFSRGIFLLTYTF